MNPIKTRLIATARIKSDKLDAKNLALLLLSGFVHTVWVPPVEVRELRALVGQRLGLNKDCTRVKNALHALLRTHRIESPYEDLFSQKGLRWLKKLELSPRVAFQRDQHLRLFEAVEENRAKLDKEIARLAGDNLVVLRLMQQAGLDYYTALAVYAEIGDIRRFPTARHLSSYTGLVPCLDQSGPKRRLGQITKAGRKRLRWLLVEAAQTASNYDPTTRRLLNRIAAKKGRNVAIAAVAHRLAVRIWHAWHNDENFRQMNKGLWTRKLQDLAYEIGCRQHGIRATDFIKESAKSLKVSLTEEQARGRNRKRGPKVEDKGNADNEPPFTQEGAPPAESSHTLCCEPTACAAQSPTREATPSGEGVAAPLREEVLSGECDATLHGSVGQTVAVGGDEGTPKGCAEKEDLAAPSRLQVVKVPGGWVELETGELFQEGVVPLQGSA